MAYGLRQASAGQSGSGEPAAEADRASQRPKTVTSQGVFQPALPPVSQQSWRPDAEVGAGAAGELSDRDKTEGALSPASPTPRPGRAHGSVSPSCVAPTIPLMRRFISSREVLSAPRWPPTRRIEVRFPEPEHLEGIWIPVGVFHMPARQGNRQELCPSRNR